MPLPDEDFNGKPFKDYLKDIYGEKIEKFLKLRERLDPDQIFVTNYWRGYFDIPGGNKETKKKKKKE